MKAEGDLADSLSASRTTIRTALRVLAGEGWLTRRQHYGTHRRPMVVMPLDRLISIPEFPAVRQTHPELIPVPIEARLLETREMTAPQLVCDLLQLPADGVVLATDSLLVQADEPIGLVTSYVALAEDERGRIVGPDPDVVTILEGQLGVEIGASSTLIGAVSADPETAALLGIASGSALSWLRDVVCDAQGRPRALQHTRMRGDRTTFTVTTSRS
jgi:GntR family transcriptional regulator